MRFKQNFRDKLLIVMLFYFGINGIAQNIRISYEMTSKTDSLKTQHYILDVISQKSIFRTQHRKKSDSLLVNTGFGLGYNANPNYELYLTKELNHTIFKKHFISPISRDKFFIKIEENLKWKISSETKVIAGFNCQKAETEYGKRHWIAWFAKNISVPEGPYYFHGLPGLIIQIQDSDGDFIFKAVEIKDLKNNSIYEMEDGKEITWNQHEKLLQDFFNDPYFSLKARGMKAYTDNESGGYKEINYRERTKKMQTMLLKNNNPIELNHKVDYK